jgi:hypothetical protein
VEDAVDSSDCFADLVGVADVAFDELDLTGDVSEVLLAARVEVIEHADLFPLGQQAVNDVRADESSAAGY